MAAERCEGTGGLIAFEEGARTFHLGIEIVEIVK